MAAQIIPTDDTPGAREAGAVHFVDGLLETMPVEELENFRAGMAAFRERVRAVHPQAGGFAELSPADQIAFLELLDEEAKDAEAARAAAIEASAENAAVEGAAAAEEWAGDEPAPEHRFFDEARSVIVMGTFCHPNQGGNEDLIGWQILGLVPEPTYQSPFGYYDRGYVAEIPTEGV